MKQITRLYLDVETASDLDLNKVGAYKYASHPSTFIRCFTLIDQDGTSWARWVHEPNRSFAPLPNTVLDALGTVEVWAHEAQFERLILDWCWPQNWPKPSFNQWRCTAALARQHGLPGGLGAVADVLDLPVKKADPRIMRKLADAQYQPTGDELRELRTYCLDDTKVCRLIHGVLGDYDDNDLFIYQMNERCNDRGVRLDMVAAARMLKHLEKENERLNAEIPGLTDNMVERVTQVSRLKNWVHFKTGRKHASLDKAKIAELLDNPSLPDDVRRVLEIRRDTAKSSTAKFKTMCEAVDSDGRLRGMFVHAGAGPGRFSSKLVQLHNLPRDVPTDAEAQLEFIRQSDYRTAHLVYGDSMISEFSRLIRPCIMAEPDEPDTVLIVADYKGVEARGLPWLAKEQSEVDAYAAGADRYIDDACSVFRCQPEDVTPDMRQRGKVVRLACGFGGAGNALLTMAKGYGVDLSESEAKAIAGAWHEANPWAKGYGFALEDAALNALGGPYGEVVKAGKTDIYYMRSKTAGKDVLLCRLPSGRVLHYHDARIRNGNVACFRPRYKSIEELWYGIFAENTDQATCNDLLRYGMAMLSREQLPLVAHVHDEFVIETKRREGLLEHVKSVLSERPVWAQTFPLEIEPVMVERYAK